MSVIVRPSGNLGPFETVFILSDRLQCDGIDFPFTVLGEYTISDDNSLAPPKPEPAIQVPQSVTPRQFRLALNDFGLRELVENAVAASPRHIRDYYEYSLAFFRDNPELLTMAAALDIPQSQIDQLFIAASKL
jgi:hypothetical protein